VYYNLATTKSFVFPNFRYDLNWTDLADCGPVDLDGAGPEPAINKAGIISLVGAGVLGEIWFYQCFSDSAAYSQTCTNELAQNRSSTKYKYVGDWSFQYMREYIGGTNQSEEFYYTTSDFNCSLSGTKPGGYAFDCECRLGKWNIMKQYGKFKGVVSELVTSGSDDDASVFHNFTKLLSDPDSYSFENTFAHREPNSDYWYGLKKRGLSKRDHEAEDVTVILDNRTVVATFSDVNSTHFVMVRKNDYSSYEEVTGLVYRLEVPDTVWLTSGYLLVQLYSGKTLLKEESFPVVAVVTCRMHDCIICLDAFENWKCLPALYKAVIIGMLITLFTLFICLLPHTIRIIWFFVYYFLWMPIAFCFNFSRKFRKVPAIRDASRKMSDRVSRAKKYFTPDDESKDIELNEGSGNSSGDGLPRVLDSDSSAGSARSRPTGSRSSSRLFSFGIIAMMCISGINAQCSSGTVIPVELKSCVSDGPGKQACDMEFEAEITIPYTGGKACLSLTANDQVVTHIEMTYSKMTEIVNINHLYYTSGWSIDSQSKHRCRSAGNCVDTKCEKISQDDYNAYGELDKDTILNVPGLVSCTRKSGGLAYGCGLPAAGCIFGRYGIEPNGPIYDVAELVTLKHQPTLSVVLSGSKGNVYDEEDVDIVGIDDKFYAVDVLIDGNLEGDLTLFGDRKAIAGNGYHYIGFASTVNSPTHNLPGDIQANSPEDFSTGLNRDSFIWDETMISTMAQDTEYTYTSTSQGISTIASAANWKLPLIVDGNNWYFEDNLLKANVQDGGALVFTVKSDGNFGAIVYSDVVCPKAVLNHVSGCYGCPQGSVANITLTSVCKSGLVLVTASDAEISIWSTAVNALASADSPTVSRIVLIAFDPNSAEVNFDMHFLGNGGNDTVHIEFTAIQIADVVNETVDTSTDLESKARSGSIWDDIEDFFAKTIPDFFDGIFKGSGSWWEYLIFAALGLGVIVLLAALLPGLFSFIKSTRTMMAMRKKLA
jgi:hypothetical protein